MTKVWPDDFPRGKVEPVTDKMIRDIWQEVARARQAQGDTEGSKRAFRIVRFLKTRRSFRIRGRRLYR